MKKLIFAFLLFCTYSGCIKTVDEYCAYCWDANNEATYLFTTCDYDKVIQMEIADYEKRTGKKTKCKFIKQ